MNMPPPGGGMRGARGFLTEEEKANKPKVTWPLITRILSYLKPYWKQMLLVLILIAAFACVFLRLFVSDKEKTA